MIASSTSKWDAADPDCEERRRRGRSGNPTGTEVKLNEAELKAAQTDPNTSPTPAGLNDDKAGPDWIQIASEGGFLPAPTVVDGQQPTTWITDPTRFDVGNVDKHSLLLAPAERADAVVDFSKFAGQTLILYNDAPRPSLPGCRATTTTPVHRICPRMAPRRSCLDTVPTRGPSCR